MKKIGSFVLVSLVIGTVSLVFAEDGKETKISQRIQGPMMGMHPMHAMMMGKSLVPAEDGGVIVMMGNKLFKYDKDLNLEKEAELKIDTEDMQKMMMEIEEKCLMYERMMREGGMMGEAREEPEALVEPNEPSGHEAHH
jgi:hypothetical protein